MPPIRCPTVCGRRVFFGGADFFFAKRLFFRYGEGCEGRASRATVGVTAKDNGGACFPLDFGITPTKGRQPSHPHRSGFFCSFHATCVPTCEWLATTDPPRLIALAAAGSKRRFRLRLRLHGVVHDMPSPMADLPPRCPTFCSFPYHPEAYHPAPYRLINRLLSKEPCKKMQRCRKAGCAILVHNFAS